MNHWLGVWTRVVIGPAFRRATAVWLGAFIVGAVIFGPTGMHPSDLTGLALHHTGVAAVLAATWLLLFVPTARLLVLPEGTAYLRALPGPRWEPLALAAAALVVLQLPWLVLWLVGEGVRGLAVVVCFTLLVAAIAAWRPRVARVRWPKWTGGQAALRGVYVRALRRRASDALIRGSGLAILAGLAAGLVVRNNHLVDHQAAVFGAGTIAIVLVPGWVGALLPLVEAQRATTWLAASLGISAGARVAVLASVVAGIYVVATLFAVGAAAITIGGTAMTTGGGASTIAWLAGFAIVVAIGTALLITRALVHASRDEKSVASRVVVGAVTASAAAVFCIGWLGVLGALGLVALGLAAVLTARPT